MSITLNVFFLVNLILKKLNPEGLKTTVYSYLVLFFRITSIFPLVCSRFTAIQIYAFQLIASVDSPLGRVNFSLLSDQTLMEMFIGDFGDENKKLTKTAMEFISMFAGGQVSNVMTMREFFK